VTTFPELEAALDAAAHRHYRRRRRFRLPLGAPVLAVACVAALALFLWPHPVPEGVPAARAPGVPAETLALSHALTLAPATQPLRPTVDEPIPHAALPAVAAEYERQTPYPPSGRDTFDWAATPDDPHNMASINFRTDVQWLVEFRAACLWMRYWLETEGFPEARQASTTVLADIPAWPSFRARGSGAQEVARQAAVGDAAVVAAAVASDCAQV
jgi:hypothetical protein